MSINEGAPHRQKMPRRLPLPKRLVEEDDSGSETELSGDENQDNVARLPDIPPVPPIDSDSNKENLPALSEAGSTGAGKTPLVQRTSNLAARITFLRKEVTGLRKWKKDHQASAKQTEDRLRNDVLIAKERETGMKAAWMEEKKV